MKDNHTLANRPENAVTWCRIAKEEAERGAVAAACRRSTTCHMPARLRLADEGYVHETRHRLLLDAQQRTRSGRRARAGRRTGAGRRPVRALALPVVPRRRPGARSAARPRSSGLYVAVRHGLDLPLAPHGREGTATAGRRRLRHRRLRRPDRHRPSATSPGSSARRSCAAWRATSSPATKATT